MTEGAFAAIAFLVLGWALVSRLLSRINITGPIAFTVVGFLLGNPDWGPMAIDVEAGSVHLVAEVTLALVLFSDASRVNVAQLRRDVSAPIRLLGIGLPLSMLLGGLLAMWLLDDLSWALAVFVGAALAPTDAALSVQVIDDERIPMRIRRALNVESGINDGIATPVVMLSLAAAAGAMGIISHSEPYDAAVAARELAVGLAVGLLVGLAGAKLLTVSARRGWIVTGGQRLATFAVAVGSFTLTLAIDGNGFIAAFVAGISFGGALDNDIVDVDKVGELPELGGELLALVVWFLFGAALVPVAFHRIDLPLVLYALLSLTVVRMLPVALSLLGSPFDRPTIAFIGWFGPRGLASVVFGVLAVEELGETDLVGRAVAAIALTVLLSVALHGVTAGPLGARYVRLEQSENTSEAGPRSRRLQVP